NHRTSPYSSHFCTFLSDGPPLTLHSLPTRRSSDLRLIYSLAATFLGRMCLSGEYDALSPDQHAIVARATRLYRQAAPLIRHGTRSEEHTSELQSHLNLVFRLLLGKKKYLKYK